MYQLRPIQASDNPQLAQIIREVSKEFGLAAESGFAVADAVVDDLYSVYSQVNAYYWVIENQHGQIFGGGGISPLKGADGILELQKMYFLTDIRGCGFAKQIIDHAMEFAKSKGFGSIYLETTQQLWQAVKLYEKMGFLHLDQARGNTGHSHACEIRMELTL